MYLLIYRLTSSIRRTISQTLNVSRLALNSSLLNPILDIRGVYYVWPVMIWYSRSIDDASKWKHFSRYWPFVRGIHRSPVNSLHKGQWRGALTFSLICVWINGWINSREAGDLRRYRINYDVTVMKDAHDFVLLWFVWVMLLVLNGIMWSLYPYISGLFQWYYGEHKIAQMPVKWPGLYIDVVKIEYKKCAVERTI